MSPSPREYDLVSAFGYSLGYAGGGVLLLVNVAMVTDPASFGLASAADAVRIAFPMVGVWWVLFTVPCLLWVREDKPARPLAAGCSSERRLAGTARDDSPRYAATGRCCGSCWPTGSTSTA